MEVTDPRWAKAYQEWWWRKCEHYGLDPIDAFASMLGEHTFDPPNSQ